MGYEGLTVYVPVSKRAPNYMFQPCGTLDRRDSANADYDLAEVDMLHAQRTTRESGPAIESDAPRER